jgi:hypothetical protein
VTTSVVRTTKVVTTKKPFSGRRLMPDADVRGRLPERLPIFGEAN